MMEQFYLTQKSNSNKYYHSDPGSNSNEGILHIPQSSRTEA